jgi:hypothetical protein
MAKIVELDSNIQERIFHIHKHGQKPGLKVGFSGLDDIYSIAPKRTTIIYGRPTDGKTQFLIQILTALACQHNKKCLIYSPESGDPYEIYAEIIHCLTGKGFNLHSQNYRITEKELFTVMPFVKDNFKVVELEEKTFDLDAYLEITEQALKDFDVFSTAVDNWNDLDHVPEAMISEYLKRQLVKWNRHAKKHEYHGFVVAHAKNVQMQKGDEFPKPARVDEIDGGYAWYAKAMNMINVYRSYEEYAEGWRQTNTAEIRTMKIKKRFEGKKGIAKIEFDLFQNCYYEKRGDNIYLPTMFKSQPEIQKNNDIQTLNNPLPF